MTALDIRWPLGAIFTVIGAILVAYGGVTAGTFAAAGIDVVWGAWLMLFGAAMLLLARHAAGKHEHHD